MTTYEEKEIGYAIANSINFVSDVTRKMITALSEIFGHNKDVYVTNVIKFVESKVPHKI